jgi:alpha-L-rhamnosidase
MAGFLPALLCAALTPLALAALPPSAEPRLFIPTPATAGSAPQPFAWLHGGSFINPAIPYHADPLARYAWAPGANASALQIFALLPASVAPMPGTPAASFLNASSLLAQGPSVTVAGAGTLQLDFGLNSAAWIEFDSPDLQASDAAAVTLGVSEYSEYEITNLGAKVLRPVAYPGAAGAATTYRLEIPHPDKSGLYEGVQYAWLSVNATPARPWTITGLRLVCQAKPTNWRGAFAAQGDDLLTQIWYTGAYTVKVNLLGDQFGSILIYRGDRFSWTGDAHVAQASSMAALGNFPFVGANLNYTRDNCNGIESYCLYLCLSVVDYYFASNDTVTTLALQPHVISKLEHAHDVWGTHVSLGFQGWDDRE